MIHVASLTLPPATQAKLDEYQDAVDTKSTYQERVKKAKSSFKSKNTKTNRTFRKVRKALDRMCAGARRCHYCEDSAADEVEHFYPKDLYPERCFAWNNYLYSCGRCNGAYKSNKFKIFEADTREVVDITPPRRNRQYVPPPPGDPLLIDPRSENPFDYLRLNLETFQYIESGNPGSEAFSRGEWTKDCLGLNEREVLVKSRREAYENYLARLEVYRAKRDTAPAEKLERMKKGIQTMAHPTVWHEMVCQHDGRDELRRLFAAVSEALDWAAEP